MSKAANKFTRDIYLSHKWRKWNKEKFLKLEHAAAEMWENLDSLSPEDRKLASSLAQLSALGQKQIAKAEEFVRSTTLTKRTYRLYRHPSSRQVIVLFHFYKPYEKLYKYNSWIIPAGLPTVSSPRRKMDFLYHQVPTDGYQLVDSGSFRHRYPDITFSICTLKGRHTSYEFKLKAMGKTQGKVWIQLLQPAR